jgi:hypothetical protein
MIQHSADAVRYSFKRSNPMSGVIQVINENSYVLAEYNENTGILAWHRVVAATQRAAIEQRLFQQFPVPGTKKAANASKN